MAKAGLHQSSTLQHNRVLQRFHAAYIDSDGNEINITEEMIQAACKALEGSHTESFSDHAKHQNPAPAKR